MIKPLIKTDKTPHLTLALVQTFIGDREPEVIVPLYVGEETTVRAIECLMLQIEASIRRHEERIVRCEEAKAPPCIAEYCRECIGESLSRIETLREYAEVVRQSWREFEADLAKSFEDDEEDDYNPRDVAILGGDPTP